MVALVAVLVAALVNVTNAFAVIETYQFTSPELEHRYHKLSQELRCPKCQNQTIADSNAPISKDLRELLHRRLESGASDQEILDDMVSRYGEFVRYRPDAAGVTLWLWLAPIGLLVLALLILVSVFRDRSAAPASLSEEQRRKIDALTRSGSVKP
ncbi:MAG: cytochrome c-type biogenesis protein [Pseudomonadota bacterium]